MKLALIIVFLSVLQVSANVYSQITINLDVQDKSIREVLKTIEQQSQVRFFYSDDLLVMNDRIDVKADNKNIISVLDDIFSKSPLTYKAYDNNLIVIAPRELLQQNKVSGIVSDKNGSPLPGANVVVTGKTLGTITDVAGKYTIEVPEGTKSLTFSFIGMEPQIISIGTLTQINVTMAESAVGLEEVVVVGYGTQKKINLTGAVDVVSGEALQNRAAANVGALLQGVSSNLIISTTPSGGEPGAGNTFNIRGIGSLTGNDAPLILVDGIEMDINNLDPETIGSVSILKDAASAAIYGSRAPFGVVLITTKKGTKNKGISVSYSNNTAFASPIYMPKWQSSLRYVTAYNQSLHNSGQPDKFLSPQIDRIKRYMAGTYTPEYDTINPPKDIWAGRHEGNANYEYFDVYFKDVTVNQKHNINISGGDEKTQYYINTGMYDQGGSYNFAKEEYYRRYNVLANLTSQTTSWLRFNLNTKYSNTNSSHPTAPWGASTWDPDRNFMISEMIKFFPTTTLYNVNGTINNPYALALQQAGPAKSNGNDLSIALGTEIEPIKGWKTNINYSYNYTGSINSWLDSKVWAEIPTGEVFNFSSDPDIFSQSWNSNNYTSFNALTSYEKTIQGHFFKGMIGYEREYRYFSNIYGKRYDLINEDVPSFSTASGAFELGEGKSHWATEAVFGRLNYNYQEKYLLEVNARYNGSSRFTEDSRWGFFPSTSVGYNISKESFWEPLADHVNNLKIRGSYGSLGNQNVPNYLYLSNIPISSNLEWIIDGQRPLYASLPGIISPSLTWETINTLNFGLDASFLNNRLGFTFDWYTRNTLNMFGPSMILPNSLGAYPPQENNASLSTKGWEISLDWKDRISSDLNYSVRVSLADNRTHVTKYLNLTGQIDQFYVGREIGEIWGYTTAGLIQTEEEVAAMPDQSYFYNNWGPGDIKYTDLNDDGKIDDGTRTLDNHGDLRVIGNSSPRYSVGFTGMVTWKNFDFSMFLQGILKRDLVPSDNMWWGVATRGDNGGAFYQGHDDYWRPADETNLFGPNTDAFYAKPYVSTETYKNQQIQTRYLLNAGYFRLKNIQLGYTIPQKITSKIRIQALKVYVSGENLLTLDKLPPFINPETAFTGSSMLGASYPMSKSVSVGLNITF